MWYMFRDATTFNGDISEWDVSSVTNMEGMFSRASAFNGDISNWDVSSVTNINSMFDGATAFEQTLCWDLTSVVERDFMFDGSSGGLGDINDPNCGKNTKDNDESSKPTLSPTNAPSNAPIDNAPIDTTSGESVGWAKRQGVRLVVGMVEGMTLLVALAY
jgi:surface protein